MRLEEKFSKDSNFVENLDERILSWSGCPGEGRAGWLWMEIQQTFGLQNRLLIWKSRRPKCTKNSGNEQRGGIYFVFFLILLFFSFFGPLVPCSSNPLVPWSSRHRHLVPLLSGPRCPGLLVLWSPGPLVPCSSGLLVPWSPVPFSFSFFLTCLLLCFTICFIYSLCLLFMFLLLV